MDFDLEAESEVSTAESANKSSEMQSFGPERGVELERIRQGVFFFFFKSLYGAMVML